MSNKLAGKLAEIMGEMGQIKREGKNEYFKYAYFTEGQLMAEIKGRLAKRGIFLMTSIISADSKPIPTKTPDRPDQLVSMVTEHTFIDSETGETLTGRGFGMGCDPGDKGAYKAFTGAVKYFLSKCFLVTDAADPEGDNATDERHGQGAREPEKQPDKPHRPTTAYEDKKATETPGAAENIAFLRQFIDENFMEEAFVIEAAFKGNQCKEDDTVLEDLKPGVLATLVARRDTLLLNWQKRLKAAELAKGAGKGKAAGGQSEAPPAGNARKREYNLNGGDRANKQPPKDDQARSEYQRQPCQSDIDPADLLRQEGLGWRDVQIHFGKNKGTRLGDLTGRQMDFYRDDWSPAPFKGKLSEKDILLDAALCVASAQ